MYDKFDFLDTAIETKSPGNFTLTQDRHVERLAVLPKTCTFDKFRRSRAMLAWLANTRPELCCLINRAAQVTEDTFKKDKITEFNKAVKIAKAKDVRGLTYGKLDVSTLRLKMYADAAFATNDDLSSQQGYIILLTDNSGRAHVLDYSSKKSKRVVRSIMGGEVYAFADGFDRSFVIRKDLEKMLNIKIPLHCYTDSKQLFDSITKGQQTTEKRLMIDIVVQCACQAGTRVQRSSSNTNNNNNQQELPTQHSSTECPILPFPLSGFAAHSSSNP